MGGEQEMADNVIVVVDMSSYRFVVPSDQPTIVITARKPTKLDCKMYSMILYSMIQKGM